MGQMTRQEINVRRLLRICEAMAKSDDKNWKLEKYIESVDEMIAELDTIIVDPSKDKITGYIKRVDFLKGIISTAKLKDTVEKVVATQMIPSSMYSANEQIGPNIMTQIHQKTSSKYNQELRTELFKLAGHSEKVGDQPSNSTQHGNDLDAVLKYNRNMQENIANNMLLMTRSMREHATIASGIIRRDIRSLEKSNKLTDVNETNLKSESVKLVEHTKSNWRCWVWFMVAFVLIVFFNMVLFMKVSRKKV